MWLEWAIGPPSQRSDHVERVLDTDRKDHHWGKADPETLSMIKIGLSWLVADLVDGAGIRLSRPAGQAWMRLFVGILGKRTTQIAEPNLAILSPSA